MDRKTWNFTDFYCTGSSVDLYRCYEVPNMPWRLRTS